MNNNEAEIKQCFWCGSFTTKENRVTVSEDVPPRWLSGIKKVIKSNCVPQCEECKVALSGLDESVNGYFKYGASIDLEKVKKTNNFLDNKGLYSRKIKLNGNEDFAQSNGCLLLWLRKLLVGLWCKEQGTYFNGGMFILAHWLSFDDPERYFSGAVTPTVKTLEILFDIDEQITGINTQAELEKRKPFNFTFVPSSKSGILFPLQLLRFSIYGSYTGYCLFVPEISESNLFILHNLFEKTPYYLKYWIRGFPYYPPSIVIALINSLKSISAEEVAKRVRVQV
jgi:hypothetical protein